MRARRARRLQARLGAEPFSADLGDAFGVRTQLGRGIERVQGGIDPSGDADFLTLNGLPAGANFVLRLDPSDGGTLDHDLYDASGTEVDSAQTSVASEPNLALVGTVPADGRLRLGMEPTEASTPTWGVRLALGDPTQEYEESASGRSWWTSTPSCAASPPRRRTPRSSGC